MQCREFRRKHDAYIDDTLSGMDIDAMDNHRRVCGVCSQLDTRVRRALLVARNLPSIQPSAEFSKRLHERLEQERLNKAFAAAAPGATGFSMATYSIVAAGLILVAGVAGVAVRSSRPEQVVVQMAPVVATTPEPLPSAFTAPAMVASMPAGMPLWPAVFVAQEAPWHLASDEASR